ncbi:MAG TPA: hypothetical protein VFA48_05900 [Gammaproteobacteria bacterium]|nr:hypothetical protein [Gammaproteobacteria bacterium]
MGIASTDLHQGEHRRLLKRDVFHERADGGKAGIAATHAVVALHLQVLEKIQDKRRVQILQREVAGRFSEAALGEGEQ